MSQASASRLILICGPPAVGKMTVGQALARQTGVKFLYNHQFIDLLKEYFPFGSPAFGELKRAFERGFMTQVAVSEMTIIYSWGWRFDLPEDTAAFLSMAEPFIDAGGSAHVVELTAPPEVRVSRNRTENRRAHKNVDWATDDVIREAQDSYSSGGRIPVDVPHLLVDTTHRTAAETAAFVAQEIGIPLMRGSG